MGWVRGLGRGGRLLVALAVGGAVFGIATVVQASIPDVSGVIHGCYNTSLAHGSPTGALRVIDASKVNGNCAPWEAPLSWNAKGVSGATGPTGPTGPTGATGPSDGWSAQVFGTIPAFPDTVVLTGGATGIPAGSYLISGQVFVGKLQSGSADISCFLDFAGSGGSAGALLHASTTGAQVSPMTGEMTLTSTATLTVECEEPIGQTSGMQVTGRVNAVRVGTLH